MSTTSGNRPRTASAVPSALALSTTTTVSAGYVEPSTEPMASSAVSFLFQVSIMAYTEGVPISLRKPLYRLHHALPGVAALEPTYPGPELGSLVLPEEPDHGRGEACGVLGRHEVAGDPVL